MKYEELINKRKGVIYAARKRTKKKRWNCFFPGCNKKAIKSHSQSASSSLKNIQKDGFVIERNFSPFPENPLPKWERISVNRASTFPGFCSEHDNKLFNQADSIGRKNLRDKSLLLLAFRTFALEMRKKEFYAEFTNRILRRKNELIFAEEDNGFLIGFNAGLKICLKVTKPFYLNLFREAIIFNKPIYMTHHVFKFETNIGVSCSSLINPIPISEQPLDRPQSIIPFNVLPRKGYTLAIMSSFADDADLLSEFVSNYRRLEDLLFNYCEEVTFSINLFESIDDNIKKQIERAQLPWMAWEPTEIPDIFGITLEEKYRLTI